MTDVSGVPHLRDELNRKSFEAIEWLVDAVRAGNLSQHQFSTGVDTLFMAVNGLVDEQFLEIVTTAADEAGKEPPVEKRIFTKSGSAVIVKWTVGESFVTYHGIGVVARKDGQVDADNPAQARERFKALADRLLATGFTEI